MPKFVGGEVGRQVDGVDESVVVDLQNEANVRASLEGPLVGRLMLQGQVAIGVDDVEKLEI